MTTTQTDYAERMFQAYVECALWSCSVEEDYAAVNDMAPDVSLESAGFGPDDIATEALDSMRVDVLDFIEGAGSDLDTIDAEQAGHDFWLTRCGHGAGFWDRGLGELGDRLTAMAQPYGEIYLYVGDDDLVYAS
jgi:hypothetical protein